MEAVASELRRDGYSEGLRLRPEVLTELLDFCSRTNCFGNGKRNHSFLLAERAQAEEQYGVKFTTGRYLHCADDCPAIEKILSDRDLLGIARSYLGAEPVMVGARCWWSFASNSDANTQTSDGQSFHYDLDDYRAVCFFFYLTDVDEESGPHICVRKSHRRKPLRYLVSPFKSRTDEDIHSTYKPEQIVSVEGKAGQGFAEDLFCYHKGSHPKSKDRLILQVRFRLQDFGGSPIGEN